MAEKKKDADQELTPGAPVANQQSSIRDATDDEKPDPTSIVQVEEIKGSE